MLLASPTPWESSNVIFCTRLGMSLLSNPSAMLCCAVPKGRLFPGPWDLRAPRVSSLSALPYPGAGLRACQVTLLCTTPSGPEEWKVPRGKGHRLRAWTPAKALVLPPHLPTFIWVKMLIQLLLILKFCDSLKCTLGMTASISISLQFQSFAVVCQS